MTTVSSTNLVASLFQASSPYELFSAKSAYETRKASAGPIDSIAISDEAQMLFGIQKALSQMQMFARATSDPTEEIAELQELTADGFDSYASIPVENLVIFGSSSNVNQKYETLGNARVWTAGGNDAVTAGDGSEAFLGEGDDTAEFGAEALVDGEGGDDTLTAGVSSTLVGGSGNDTLTADYGSTLYGDDGDDVITTGGESWVEAGDGADTVTAGDNSEVWGGSADDTLSVGAGATVSGGAGDDAVTLTGDGASVLWGPDQGSDTVTGSVASTIRFGAGLQAKNLAVSVQGDDLVLAFSGKDETITYKNYRGSSPTLVFSDRTTVEMKF